MPLSKDKQTWYTQNGRAIPVPDLSDMHLCNIIHYAIRKREEHLIKRAQEAQEEATLVVLDEAMETPIETAHPDYAVMVAEAERRGVDYKRWCSRCQLAHDEYCFEEPCKYCGGNHPKGRNREHRKAMGCMVVTHAVRQVYVRDPGRYQTLVTTHCGMSVKAVASPIKPTCKNCLRSIGHGQPNP